MIYNSRTQRKEPFKSIQPGQVRMYVCGPTVYDFLHVGNFRGIVFFSLVRYWLEKQGYSVKFVYNYTDVDDKIIHRAQKEGVDPQIISEQYIREFEKDFSALKLPAPTLQPKVTEFIGPIINMIERLLENGKAYVLNGDVYYSVLSFKEYGQLSRKNLEDLESGYRIDVDRNKKHSADFALWKSAKSGEPFWDSPWGQGRPGWHIECSSMATTLLGETIDIHGGGMDLIFPHHENEVAQSEGATGKTFVHYWMHNNMINMGQQKMSKSLGNVHTFRAFCSQNHPEVFKFMMFSSHYRSVLDLSDSTLQNAVAALAKFYSSLTWAEKLQKENLPLVPVPEKFQNLLSQAQDKIEAALNDDFNTPEVLAQWYEVLRHFNASCRTIGTLKPEQKAIAEVYGPWLKTQGAMIALFQESPQNFLQQLDDQLLQKKGLQRNDINQLVQSRQKAREQKNFTQADELRKQLMTLGIAVRDHQNGTDWEVEK
ncbi:MAG: cysteine--tRNA ligase [Bdellovibrionales bacterium]|nr:cysteine--tRNA ligase [Bdellovibrionales bacterium]